jgi:hypothetical protein
MMQRQSTAGGQSMMTTGIMQGQDMYGGGRQITYFNPGNMNRSDMVNHMQQNLI